MTASPRIRPPRTLPKSLFDKLNRQAGRGIHKYAMIRDRDKIAVGLSGGKDSFTLLWVLAERLARAPIHYELVGVHIDPGFETNAGKEIGAFCKNLGIPFHEVKTDNGPLAHSEENRENPCFLCARLRKKALFTLAAEQGCQKIALGHHKDDLIETLFLNMCYAGEIATMVPFQEFFGGEVTVIRPLAFVDEDVVSRFARLMGFPEIRLGCPSEGTSKRKEIKELLQSLYKRNRKIKGNIFRSLSRVRPEYLLR